MEDLKPCPFCGADEHTLDQFKQPAIDFMYYESREVYAVICKNCEIQGAEDVTESLAGKKWNKRSNDKGKVLAEGYINKSKIVWKEEDGTDKHLKVYKSSSRGFGWDIGEYPPRKIVIMEIRKVNK